MEMHRPINIGLEPTRLRLSTFQCSRCRTQIYRNREEQKTDWPRHSRECVPFTNIASGNLEHMTLENTAYRREVYTIPYIQQMVLMCITPEDDNEIERERHQGTVQFFRVEAGEAIFEVDGVETRVGAGGFYMVPPNTWHHVKNVTPDGKPLKLYTIYSPPQHAPGTLELRRRKE